MSGQLREICQLLNLPQLVRNFVIFTRNLLLLNTHVCVSRAVSSTGDEVTQIVACSSLRQFLFPSLLVRLCFDLYS